mmetsp:Transcript_1711/g.4392  ORF Transcript_1711/g.4392 Transcript_1711/m.4392 type:complete len:103 (-) Transcript_1711:691-999(-)
MRSNELVSDNHASNAPGGHPSTFLANATKCSPNTSSAHDLTVNVTCSASATDADHSSSGTAVIDPKANTNSPYGPNARHEPDDEHHAGAAFYADVAVHAAFA